MNHDNFFDSLCGGEEPIFSKPQLLGDNELLNLRKMELFSQQNQAGECLWWPPENKDDCLREMLSLSGVDNQSNSFCGVATNSLCFASVTSFVIPELAPLLLVFQMISLVFFVNLVMCYTFCR